MLRLSKRMLFALEAVLDIANSGANTPVQSREIMRRQHIPERYLEPVMQRLVRAGLLKGVRGPKGGYLLARERRRIKLSEIVRVVGALERARKETGAEARSPLAQKVLDPLWYELDAELMARLEAITLEDLCRRAQASGIESEGRARLDFSI